MSKKETQGYGTVSLVLGIISMIFGILSSVFIGMICGILGIVFSVKQKKISQTGVSTAGLITSIIGLMFSVFWIILLIITFAF